MDELTRTKALELIESTEEDVIIAACLLVLEKLQKGKLKVTDDLFPSPNPNKYYTIDEVCSVLKCSRSFIYSSIGCNDVRAYKIGKSYKIAETDLRDFVKKSRHKRLAVNYKKAIS